MGVMKQEDFLKQVRGRLIVSCQALPEEPLHSSDVMARMASAVGLGGAAGILADSMADITAIRGMVDLPILGTIKKRYGMCDVYITPTMGEIDDLVQCGVEVVALDATARPRPDWRLLDGFFTEARVKYPDQLFMADCSNVEEGIRAAELGFDLISTTMAGFTPYTKGRALPPFDMIETLVQKCGRPVVVEGGISTPQQLRQVMDLGVLAVVVGSAITRPTDITKRFVAALE